MKTVGIIGGIGPESTVEYYRSIIASYRQQNRDSSYPSILINSIDLNRMIDLVESRNLDGLTEYIVDEVEKLARAGADFGALSSNTPHIVFEEISRQASIPLISIVETTCEAAKALGLKRVGLFGTRFTMQGEFYPKVFSRAGISVVAPEEDDQTFIHKHYMGELVKGSFLPKTRERLLEIAHQLKERERIEALILGGTELPLILRDDTGSEVRFLDTTQIHVSAIVAQLLS
jgi:aspartate racemase